VGRLDEEMQGQAVAEHWCLQKEKGNVPRIRGDLRSRFRWRDRESDQLINNSDIDFDSGILAFPRTL